MIDMVNYGRLREVEISTQDTRTNMTTRASNGTPGTLRAPGEASRARMLWSAVGFETPTLADGGGGVFVRVWGDAINGEHVIPLAGFVIGGTTAGEVGAVGTNFVLPVDIDLEGTGADYSMAAECGGVEAHQPSVCANLIFE